jgi:hypothetical protein
MYQVICSHYNWIRKIHVIWQRDMLFSNNRARERVKVLQMACLGEGSLREVYASRRPSLKTVWSLHTDEFLKGTSERKLYICSAYSMKLHAGVTVVIFILCMAELLMLHLYSAQYSLSEVCRISEFVPSNK